MNDPKPGSPQALAAEVAALRARAEAAEAKLREQALDYLALDGQACEALERAAKAEAERDAAVAALSEAARKRGEAEGRLEASEMAGVVEGWRTVAESNGQMAESWRARAEAAEAEAARLRPIVERTVAMIARGRTIDAHAERVAADGGSGTPVMWAAEAYDELLNDLDRNARAALTAPSRPSD